jgi:hypothetical protein
MATNALPIKATGEKRPQYNYGIKASFGPALLMWGAKKQCALVQNKKPGITRLLK